VVARGDGPAGQGGGEHVLLRGPRPAGRDGGARRARDLHDRAGAAGGDFHGALSGLAAPTPLLHCVGFADWSTPKDAYEIARDEVRAAYAEAGAAEAVAFHEAEAPGHEETAAMRASVCAFLDDRLG
jgi:hypothetical protein